MRDSNLEQVTSGGLEIENLISVATYPFRYFAKFSQISYEERQREVIALPLKATTDFQKKSITREPSTMELHFNDLPVNLQLLIFSYLDARTLCEIASTCEYWRMLSEDRVLWDTLLWTDLQTWKSISHMTYPHTYMEASSELSPKQIYLKCCPQCQSLRQSKSPRNSFASLVLHSLPSMFRRHHPPKVVMFGPGLESDTHKLVHRFLWGQPLSPATVVGMFPGEFEGIGSGVQLTVNGTEMNLITLYAACRAVRERNAREGKDRVSKLLVPGDHHVVADGDDNDDERGDDGDSSPVEVSHPVKQLCKTVDAFIYVVDASAESKRVNTGDQELQAMVNNSWTQPRVPLLVLSAHATVATPILSCARVTEMLRMNQFNHPWQVNSVCVENLDGLEHGLNWLLKQVA